MEVGSVRRWGVMEVGEGVMCREKDKVVMGREGIKPERRYGGGKAV